MHRKEVTIMEEKHMPNATEIAVKLARQLERIQFVCFLKECRSMDDIQSLILRYEALTQDPEN